MRIKWRLVILYMSISTLGVVGPTSEVFSRDCVGRYDDYIIFRDGDIDEVFDLEGYWHMPISFGYQHPFCKRAEGYYSKAF